MKDSGSMNQPTKNIGSESVANSFNENLKTIALVTAGALTVSYLASKYESSAKSFMNWITGSKPSERSKRRSRRDRLKGRRRMHTERKHRDAYNTYDASETSQTSSLDDDILHKNRSNRRGLYYIPEESTIFEESETHEDFLEVADAYSTTSIGLTVRDRGNVFMNANDEIVNYEEAQDAYDSHNEPLPKNGRGKVVSKLYKQRELEAHKFVKAIDSAVRDFKTQKVKLFKKEQGFQRNLREDLLSDDTKTDLQNQVPASLHDKYKAEMQQLNPKKSNKNGANFDEKSVRLNDCVSDQKGLRRGASIKASTIASDDYVSVGKKSSKVVSPTQKDLSNKNDYIFFELLSVYADSYLKK